jgi:hypothetical protein
MSYAYGSRKGKATTTDLNKKNLYIIYYKPFPQGEILGLEGKMLTE